MVIKHNEKFVKIKLWNDKCDIQVHRRQRVKFMNFRTDWYTGTMSLASTDKTYVEVNYFTDTFTVQHILLRI